MANNTAKTLVTFFDDVCEQVAKETTMAELVNVDSVPGSTLQNANNIYWRPVEQQSPEIEGWDLTGQETGIIEQSYPSRLSDPRNDFVQLRVDELRDKRFMERRVRASSAKIGSGLNRRIADLAASTGTLYAESGAAGYDFVAEARTILRERQAYTDMGMSFFFNPRDYQIMGSDLASREDLSGRPEAAYGTAGIGKRVAGFDAFEGSYLGNIGARLNGTGSTVDGDVVEVPQGFIDLGNDVFQNVDYRVGNVSLATGGGANFAVGDVITFQGVNALAVMDKIDTGQLMTFRIVAKSGDDLTIYPKPIAADQAGITPEQAAYANISTAITDGTVVAAVNVNGGRCNTFWANDSIEIINGDAPLETLNEFEGMKVVSQSLPSGVKLYMAYDARLDSLNCRVRLFAWYGLVNKDPSRNGNMIYVPA